MIFGEEKISDSKREVRQRAHLLAQRFLRESHGEHFPHINALMLAGGAPHEEISLMKNVYRNVYLEAWDTDKSCCQLAKKSRC